MFLEAKLAGCTSTATIDFTWNIYPDCSNAANEEVLMFAEKKIVDISLSSGSSIDY